jgi:hypothetical protein
MTNVDLIHIILKAFEANPDKVKQYLDGKKSVAGFFVGHVMRETNDVADPGTVNRLVMERLEHDAEHQPKHVYQVVDQDGELWPQVAVFAKGTNGKRHDIHHRTSLFYDQAMIEFYIVEDHEEKITTLLSLSS